MGRFADDHGVAGLAAGIVRDGRLVHAVTIGHSSIAGNRPVTARSVFRAGSISKILTAIAVMQLVADGRVDLDGPVNDHLSEFSINTPVGSRPVTVRDLLTHTSGIGELRRWSDIARPSIGMAVAPDRPMPSLGDYYAPALQAGVPAGQKWSYANHGFAVLGAVVEHVTGKSFAQYVRDAILDPLAMTGSDFSRSDRVSAELCDGYAIGRRGNKAVRYMDIIPGPAGALFTNLDDMARFIGVLCDEGGNILDAASLGMMISPQFHVDTRLPAMGLAFFLSNLAGHRVVSHDGGVDGFISHLRVAPDDGAGVIVFTNSASTEISMAIDRLGDELLQVVLLGGVLPRS
ncbi:MAG: serine hydrolase domain-containing protein, partial [Ilumatobacteraceae bacterium]